MRRGRTDTNWSGRPIAWSAPFGQASGYAEEARAAVLALDAAGCPVRADPFAWRGWEVPLATGAAERLERLVELDPPREFIHVIHSTPEWFYRHQDAVRSIGRTMFETDRIPRDWVPRCNALDEVWVPSDFNIESFARSGVAREKLCKLAGPLPPEVFDRDLETLPLPGARGFVFLCVCTWLLRKGWDALVRAFVEEFAPTEDVTLVLAIPPDARVTAAAQLDRFLRETLGRDPAAGPRVLLRTCALSDLEMPRLYRAADAYVMPSRGEGWGRPYMEAMACGLPTIGTRWSGNLEFMDDDNSYLVDCRVVDVPHDPSDALDLYSGHRWAEPSIDHLRELMRRVFRDVRDARRRASRARAEVLDRYSPERFSAAVLERVGAAPPRRRRSPPRSLPRVAWHGDQFAEHSLANVNRGLTRALLGGGRVALTLDCEPPPADEATVWPPALRALARPSERFPDVHVRHRWPPDLSAAPGERSVIILPWEWGSLPRAWVEPLNRHLDEIWVPTSYVRQGMLESGVRADKLVVVPNGVDPLRFHPRVLPLDLPTARGFRFLFAGGAIQRKGCDIALRAYIDEFGPDDDVCLVITDVGGRSFYRGQTLRGEIRALQRRLDTPEILYLGDAVPDEAMPSLYAACDCLLAPYRGEGFGLPIAEGMASALPVIVTAHGACLDFCDPDVAYLVPAQEHRASEARVADLETVAAPRWAEVDRDALRAALRAVVDRPAAARAVGQRASEVVRRTLTWQAAAEVAAERLETLAVRRRRRPSRRAPTLSGCTIVRDAVRLAYPLEASLRSYLGACDEVVVAYDPACGDGTEELVADLARRHPIIRPVARTWATRHDAGAELARQTNAVIADCTGDWILYVQADEAIHEGDHAAIRALLRDRGACAGRFDRRMFLVSPDREIPRYRTPGLLRLFRRGSAWAEHDATSCALSAGEWRAVRDTGFRMFDYGRVGSPESVLRRKRALHVFYDATAAGMAAALQGELEQPTEFFNPDAHPAAMRACPEPPTLAVLLGPGEAANAEPFAEPFREWPGDVVVLDDSGGDGGRDALCAALVRAGVPPERIRLEGRPSRGDFAAARNRAHELAAGRWVLHADLDEIWDAQAVARLGPLTISLEAGGHTVCAFPRANFLDGVCVNDLPPSEWTEEGLRLASALAPAWPPAPDHQYRLLRRHVRWRSMLHEHPMVSRDQVVLLKDGWIVHSKTLGRQRRQDRGYRKLGQPPDRGVPLRDRVLAEALARLPADAIVAVEAGTLRDATADARRTDGWSTLQLARALARRNGGGSRLFSIDNDPAGIATAQSVVPADLHRVVEWICDDAATAIGALPVERIDLLYLDSADDPAVALAEFTAAAPRLHARSVVVVDDTGSRPDAPQGKGTLIVPRAEAAGWRAEHRGDGTERMTLLWPAT